MPCPDILTDSSHGGTTEAQVARAVVSHFFYKSTDSFVLREGPRNLPRLYRRGSRQAILMVNLDFPAQHEPW